ncbi:hypothetical protein [Ruminococcus sp.]|uniref:hypothetical protein n=1 Tax=Ruminococcus sp. TaxID=41978 RepID=UPI00386F9BE8
MNSQKQNRHSLMAKGILVLLSLLVLIFVFSYAWFAPATAEASGLSVKAKSSGDFDFALGFYNSQTVDTYKYTNWFSGDNVNLDLTNIDAVGGGNYNLLADYSPLDLTGNGATLVRPAMQNGNREIDRSTTGFSESIPNVQYVMFDMIFRTKAANSAIYLDSDSYARGACEDEPGNGALVLDSNNRIQTSKLRREGGDTRSDAEIFNASTYGRLAETASSPSVFSKDAVVGAVRVAFVPFDETQLTFGESSSNATIWTNTDEYKVTSAPNLLWLPRPDIRLNPHQTEGADDMYGWTLSTGLESGATFVHTYYSPSLQQDVSYNNTVISPEASSNDKITNISNRNGQYYYSKVKVVIWLEGNDTEARRAISGGKFEVNFDFKGAGA